MNNGIWLYLSFLALAAGLAVPISVLAAGIGQGRVGGAALEAIARQPEAAGRIQTAMIIALALIESLVIYALLVSLIILFVVGGFPDAATVRQAITGAAGGG